VDLTSLPVWRSIPLRLSSWRVECSVSFSEELQHEKPSWVPSEELLKQSRTEARGEEDFLCAARLLMFPGDLKKQPLFPSPGE